MQQVTLNKLIYLIVFIAVIVFIYNTMDNPPTIEYNAQLLEQFYNIATKNPNHPALMVRKRNKWNPISYSEYYNQCVNFAKSLKFIGLEKGTCVCIMGYNAPGYMIAHLGTIMAGCIPVGIYTTNNEEMCIYIARNCEAKILVVENNEYLNKFSKLFESDNCKINNVVIYSEKPKTNAIRMEKNATLNTYEWNSFIRLGRNIQKLKVTIENDDSAALIYTSGTTSKPKGAIITYKNINASLKSMMCFIKDSNINIKEYNERFVSYLPLNHIAAQMIDIYMPIYIGGTVYLADKMALKDTLIDTLKACRPTIFGGVPRVWEKIKEKTDGKINIPLVYPLTTFIKYKMGLHRCKMFITMAAPLPHYIKEYFIKFGIKLQDVYGLSETCGPIFISNKILPGIKVKIDPKTKEILVNGDNVFKGYFGDPVNTQKSLVNGWFKTGDKGYKKRNYLYINGRLKDMIITAGGENIMPTPIENKIRKELPFIENVVIIGNGKKFLSCLITVNRHNDYDYDNKIKIGIDKVNKNANSRVDQIKKWKVLDNIFTVDGGELTPTMKIKRYFIEQKYKDIIEKMYTP